MSGRTATSASGGRQWGAHRDSNSGAALCHRRSKGREGKRAQKRAAGTGLGGRPASRPERDSQGTPGRAWHGPVGERKGLGFVRGQPGRAPQSWAGDTLSSGPTSLLLSLHYNELLIAGTPPSETHCRGRVRTSLTQGPASKPGTQSLHVAAPSGSSCF